MKSLSDALDGLAVLMDDLDVMAAPRSPMAAPIPLTAVLSEAEYLRDTR